MALWPRPALRTSEQGRSSVRDLIAIRRDSMQQNPLLIQRWIAVLREWRAEAIQQREWREALRAEARVDWGRLEGKKHFALLPRRDVEACRTDVALQAASDSLSARSRFEEQTRDCFGCGRSVDEMEWIFFQSPLWTWTEQTGRAGWVVYCPRCDNQVSFHRLRMS
jgi:hypothetical protein